MNKKQELEKLLKEIAMSIDCTSQSSFNKTMKKFNKVEKELNDLLAVKHEEVKEK